LRSFSAPWGENKGARAGRYPGSSIKEVPPKLRASYFEKDAQGFKIKTLLQGGIHWLVHDFMEPPPGSDFDLIFLRNNLLTYYTPELAKAHLRRIVETLSPRAFLVIGSHEKIPASVGGLTPFGGKAFVFRKIDSGWTRTKSCCPEGGHLGRNAWSLGAQIPMDACQRPTRFRGRVSG